MQDIYLITGATGFVGSNIVRKLILKKKNVHILTREKKLNWRLLDIASKITIHKIDLLSSNLQSVINDIKPTYIFHLAAYGSLPKEENIKELIDINFLGTVNLINALKQNKFKLFINTGSSSEYGIKAIPMVETDLPFPINDYGITKLAATLYVSKEAVKNNLPLITFRLFSVYGKYEEKTRLIPSVILAAIENKPIEVGNPVYVRDFVYIDDVVDAYFQACKVKVLPGEIFNIGCGVQHSIGEVVDTIRKITKSSSIVKWDGVKKQSRQVEPKMWQADVSKARKKLNWVSGHTLEKGLLSTIQDLKKYYVKNET